MRQIVVYLIVTLIVAGCAAAAAEITILYTNDLHLRLSRLDSISGLVTAERARSHAVLLLDAGDTWQDFRNPIFAVWGAQFVVEWMNEAGYDAMALGNHDFYWGARDLDRLAAAAEFPLVCANLTPATPTSLPFAASTRKTVAGVDVLVIGIVTEEYFPYLDYPWLTPIDAASAVRKEIAAQGPGIDLVVCVGHLPIVHARAIASAVPAIDVFLTGHSHEETAVPICVGDTLVVQSGAFGRNLGRLVLDVDPETGERRFVSNDLVPTEKAPAEIGRGLVRLSQLLALLALILGVVLS